MKFYWCVIICFILLSKSIFISSKNIRKEEEKPIKKRGTKSLGERLGVHHGFEMFSMMDFPNKKLKKYAADPIQRLLYSEEDLGQINGILTDRDVIDLKNMLPGKHTAKPSEKDVSNLIPEEEQKDISTPSTRDVYPPSNNIGFKPESISASVIDFFNRAVDMTKPTKKQSKDKETTRSQIKAIVRTTKRQQLPFSRKRLRELMIKISTILDEDSLHEPTKSMLDDCTNKVSTNDQYKASDKTETINTEDHSGNNNNANPSLINKAGFPYITKQENPVAKSKQKPDSSDTTTQALRSTARTITSRSASTTMPNKRQTTSTAVEQRKRVMTERAVITNSKPTGSTREIKREKKTKFETSYITTIPHTTAESYTHSNKLPETRRQGRATAKIKEGTPRITAIKSQTSPTKSALLQSTKRPAVGSGKAEKKPMNVTKIVSRIVKRYKNDEEKPRIFKIREWRLPLFTVRKPCPVKADAIFTGRTNKVYVIDGDLVYVIGRTGVEEGPKPIAEYWPRVSSPVDDVYVRPDDRMATFFSGGRYISYYNDQVYASGPNDVAVYGLPDQLKTFDAVSTWTGNRRTYFFKGSYYWRFNEHYRRIDYGYPRRIGRHWRGLPNDLDAAFIAPNQYLYFIKDGLIYKVDYYRAVVRYRYPKRLYDSCYEFFM